MPPLAIIKPNEVWTRRAAIFSGAFLVLVLIGGYFVPLVLLLAPFIAFRLYYAWRAMNGRVGIDIYEERLVLKPALGKRREVKKSDVVRFVAVYRGTTEVVVARREDVDVRGEQNRKLMHERDVVMPGGLMRSPGLVSRLESWRLGTFSTDYLFADEPKGAEVPSAQVH
jgi:hypothetical protein